MDVAALALVERTKITQQIIDLQNIFDGRQVLQDFLALRIDQLQAELSALDSQVAEFPADISNAVGIAVAAQTAEVPNA